MVVAAANVHDTKLLRQTLEDIVVARQGGPGKPRRTWKATENRCQDKGYDCPTGRAAVADGGCRPLIRRIGEEKLDASGGKLYPARPWVVEHTLAGLSRCRAILVRYDKKCPIIWA